MVWSQRPSSLLTLPGLNIVTLSEVTPATVAMVTGTVERQQQTDQDQIKSHLIREQYQIVIQEDDQKS